MRFRWTSEGEAGMNKRVDVLLLLADSVSTFTPKIFVLKVHI